MDRNETLEKLDGDTGSKESVENENVDFDDQKSPLLQLKPKLERHIDVDKEINVQSPGNRSEELEGFSGSIQHVFYCDFCGTAFISQGYAEEHINKYHKILKNYHNFISDHSL